MCKNVSLEDEVKICLSSIFYIFGFKILHFQQKFQIKSLISKQKTVSIDHFLYFLRACSTLVQQYSPLMEQRHKQSAAEMVQQTAESLSNAFACDEPSPEDLIFNLFKIPNKEEASIGKLIMVWLPSLGIMSNLSSQRDEREEIA